MSSSSSQRVHVISGANRGLGLEAVKRLNQLHPNDIILMGSRDENAATKLIQTMTLEQQKHIKPLQLDVTDEKSVKNAAEKVKSEYGSITSLISNAGIAPHGNSVQVAKQTFDVNYFGVKRLYNHFAPLVRDGGVIVTVSSEVGAWNLHSMKQENREFLLSDKLTEVQLDQFVQKYFDLIAAGKADTEFQSSVQILNLLH
jgi:NAD(P)-dependent dehydrogenase (short-subunit alcohol dehydrogenase family)